MSLIVTLQITQIQLLYNATIKRSHITVMCKTESKRKSDNKLFNITFDTSITFYQRSRM